MLPLDFPLFFDRACGLFEFRRGCHKRTNCLNFSGIWDPRRKNLNAHWNSVWSTCWSQHWKEFFLHFRGSRMPLSPIVIHSPVYLFWHNRGSSELFFPFPRRHSGFFQLFPPFFIFLNLIWKTADPLIEISTKKSCSFIGGLAYWGEKRIFLDFFDIWCHNFSNISARSQIWYWFESCPWSFSIWNIALLILLHHYSQGKKSSPLNFPWRFLAMPCKDFLDVFHSFWIMNMLISIWPAEEFSQSG
jgi:hypothetical protein